MTARIKPQTAPFDDDIQATFDSIMPDGVPPLTLFTTLARDPRLFHKFASGGLLDKGNLSLRQREIVIDRVTARCGSEYEWGVHIAFFAERIELSEAQVYSLVHGDENDDCWGCSTERLLIRMCDELHTACGISDALWQELSADFCDEAVLELLLLAGFYRTVSYLTNATKLPLEAFAARFPEA